jgi:hypothetical protein
MSDLNNIQTNDLIDRFKTLLTSLNDLYKQISPTLIKIANIREELEVIKVELQNRGEFKVESSDKNQVIKA